MRKTIFFLLFCCFLKQGYCGDDTAHKMAEIICKCMTQSKGKSDADYISSCKKCISEAGESNMKVWKKYIRGLFREEEFSDDSKEPMKEAVKKALKEICPEQEQIYHSMLPMLIKA